jgi:hypothetical protein
MTRPSTERSSGATLVIDVGEVLAGHLAVAIRAHRQYLQRQRLPSPKGLEEIERIFINRSRTAHQRSEVEELEPVRDNGAMSLLLSYREAAVVLGVSASTGGLSMMAICRP